MPHTICEIELVIGNTLKNRFNIYVFKNRTERENY